MTAEHPIETRPPAAAGLQNARGGSPLEQKFLRIWRAIGGSPLVAEFRFHPSRRWRFDFAVPNARVGIECHGGIYSRGAHVRPAGVQRDYEKLNAAQFAGWEVFQFSPHMVTEKNLRQLKEHIAELI